MEIGHYIQKSLSEIYSLFIHPQENRLIIQPGIKERDFQGMDDFIPR